MIPDERESPREVVVFEVVFGPIGPGGAYGRQEVPIDRAGRVFHDSVSDAVTEAERLAREVRPGDEPGLRRRTDISVEVWARYAGCVSDLMERRWSRTGLVVSYRCRPKESATSSQEVMPDRWGPGAHEAVRGMIGEALKGIRGKPVTENLVHQVRLATMDAITSAREALGLPRGAGLPECYRDPDRPGALRVRFSARQLEGLTAGALRRLGFNVPDAYPDGARSILVHMTGDDGSEEECLAFEGLDFIIISLRVDPDDDLTVTPDS